MALARSAYERGSVRFRPVPLSGFDHVVASRQGLFAVCETGHALIAHGQFFGLTVGNGAIYAFEACDAVWSPTFRGRLVRLDIGAGRIARAEVVADTLDNGCHQIDFIDDCLCVVDTYNQRIVRFSPDFAERQTLRPLPAAKLNDWPGGYAHVNSLLQVGDNILLVLHNGAEHTGRPSAIAVLDRAWRLSDIWILPGSGCHNVVVLEDGSLLCCGSQNGELITRERAVGYVGPMMTRGLSVDAHGIVVGASHFAAREERFFTTGSVFFLDRQFRLRARLELPGAPTEVRRLDGNDYSLSALARKDTRFFGRREREDTRCLG